MDNTTEPKTICQPCQENNHDSCTEGDCQCPNFQEKKAVHRELAAVSRADAILAEAILSTLQYSGSAICKMMVDGAGRDHTTTFVAQIIRTLKAMNN